MNRTKWTVGKVLVRAKELLREKGISQHGRDAEEMLSVLLNLSRVELYTSLDRPMNLEELEEYKAMLRRRMAGEPLQYITGFEWFWKHRFKVTPQVLIPRPETEILVAQAIAFIDDTKEPSPLVCDVGIGSGAILGSVLADRGHVLGVGTDVSYEALKVAKENLLRLKVMERCSLVCTCLMRGIRPEERFSVVVANMPYVSSSEMGSLQREVAMEPRIALDGGPDGLFWISQLVLQVAHHLKPGGMLAIEISPQQVDKVKLLFKGKGYDGMKVLKDHLGRDRVVTVVRTKER